MTVLTITLEPPLSDFVDDLVATGRYESINDAVADALLRLRSETAYETPEYTAWLKSEVQKGLADIEAGRIVDYDPQAILAEARRRNSER
jgi:antitoxin ParD1/3/4